jgi:hypothetical protein
MRLGRFWSSKVFCAVEAGPAASAHPIERLAETRWHAHPPVLEPAARPVAVRLQTGADLGRKSPGLRGDHAGNVAVGDLCDLVPHVSTALTGAAERAVGVSPRDPGGAVAAPTRRGGRG